MRTVVAEQIIASDSIKVWCLSKSSTRVFTAINLLIEHTACHHITSTAVYKMLLPIVGTNNRKLILGKHGVKEYVTQDFTRRTQTPEQRIQSEKTATHGDAEFKPGAQAVESFSNGRRGHVAGAFTQHTVSEDSLKKLVLYDLSRTDNHIDTYGRLTLRPEHIERDITRQRQPLRSGKDGDFHQWGAIQRGERKAITTNCHQGGLRPMVRLRVH